MNTEYSAIKKSYLTIVAIACVNVYAENKHEFKCFSEI